MASLLIKGAFIMYLFADYISEEPEENKHLLVSFYKHP